MIGQRTVINALAIYKQWKIDKGYTTSKEDTYEKHRADFSRYDKITSIIIDAVKPKKQSE